MYPQMIADAKGESNKAAEQTFSYANEVEKIHADLYKKASDAIGKERGDRLLCVPGVRQHGRGWGAGQLPHMWRCQDILRKSTVEPVNLEWVGMAFPTHSRSSGRP